MTLQLKTGVIENKGAYQTANQGFSSQVMSPSPDALQEFRLETNNYSAEYGRASGAVVNASLRAGIPAVVSINDFHYTNVHRDHMKGAHDDIERLRRAGLIYFQIDSTYGIWLR